MKASIIKKAKRLVKRAIAICQSTWLSYPKNVKCNICNWEGRRFLSDGWHDRVMCPVCRNGIRHRLPLAALQEIDELSFARLIHGKRVLHFAPENVLSSRFQHNAAKYLTADFLRKDCDFQADMSNMPQIEDGSFDLVIAFDVLEHVPNYQSALKEIHRLLSPGGYAMLSVPQQDHLEVTYEDPAIVTEEERARLFGQTDHLRIFGKDFPTVLESNNFVVTCVTEASFPEELRQRYVLFPPVLSSHPLATNLRTAFFARKIS